jgi:hypothetical protein
LEFDNYFRGPGGTRSGDRYRLVYAEVAGATFGAPAQPFPVIAPERFYPLEPGDLWVYEERAGMSGPYTTRTGYVERQVLGDTVIVGIGYRILRERQFSPAGELTDTRRCGVRRTGPWFEWVPIEGDCSPIEEAAEDQGWSRPFTATGWYMYDCAVPIATTVSNLPACLEMRVDAGYPPVWEKRLLFAADVGFVYYRHTDNYNGPSFWRILTHAVVGGVTYGQYPVATEPEPDAAAALQVRPNPVRGWATLEVILPSATEVRAEAFDALGRLVHTADLGTLPAGAHLVRVDARGWAPGLYILRITTGDGRTTTARVARAD